MATSNSARMHDHFADLTDPRRRDVTYPLINVVVEKRSPGRNVKAARSELHENEWLIIDLAAKLHFPKNTVCAWIKRGWIRVVRQLPGYRGRMICWADADELDRLRRLRETRHGWWDPPLPTELTTPKRLPTHGRSSAPKPR